MQRTREFFLPVRSQWEKYILDGHKTVEGRINIGSVAKIRKCDVLRIGRAICDVDDVATFNCFREMLLKCGLQQCLPGVDDIEKGIAIYHAFPRYEMLATMHGVIAIFLKCRNLQVCPYFM